MRVGALRAAWGHDYRDLLPAPVRRRGPAPADVERDRSDGAACARPDLSHDWLRVAAGVYAPRVAWQEAAWMERYELLLEAAHRKYGEDLVLAGASAVTAYGLPLVGTVLRRVEVVDGRPAGYGPPC